MKKKLKNIRIEGLRWRDKVNGNSYFSARGYVDGEYVVVVPFQYGYGEHYVHVTWLAIVEKLHLTVKRDDRGYCRTHLWQYCTDNKMEYYSHIHDALKREVIRYGTA